MEDTGTEYPKTNVGFGWDAMMVLYHALLKAEDPTNGEEVRDILENDTKDVIISSGDKLTIDPSTHRPTLDLGMYIATYDASNELVYLAYRTTDFSK
ncbi:MAG: ABC transporter substrate-binding protein, partial [Clostridiaceae bacterium]|nr:ABC transporter substrate-binding protein [Clostridiaceae bacterium]